jgi:hypothetical protein
VARDATARLYDVDANSVKMDKIEGTIRFQARNGRLVPLDQLHESIKSTRLGDGTGMALQWLEVKVRGKVVIDPAVEKEIKIDIPGSDQYFLLGEDPTAPTQAEKTAFKRLREALARGEQVGSVSGRLDGWKGNLTQLSKQLPEKPRRLLVRDFETVKP